MAKSVVLGASIYLFADVLRRIFYATYKMLCGFLLLVWYLQHRMPAAATQNLLWETWNLWAATIFCRAPGVLRQISTSALLPAFLFYIPAYWSGACLLEYVLELILAQYATCFYIAEYTFKIANTGWQVLHYRLPLCTASRRSLTSLKAFVRVFLLMSL